jgi:hypothetical protein
MIGWARLAGVLLAGTTLVAADDARQIVTDVHRRAQSTSQHYEGLLQVIDAKGKTSSEKRWSYDRRGAYGNSKVVIRFQAPAEVKGVALLVVNHPDKSADQWMWTPALNRERRIALQDRRTRFFGTDFSFEDLEERDVDHNEYKALGEESLDGEVCWKIEATPREGRRSQYTKSLLWIRKSNYSYAQIENFDAARLIRRLKYRAMENIQGIWTAKVLEMEDFTRNSKTILTTSSLQYNVPAQEDQFTLQALRRE